MCDGKARSGSGRPSHSLDRGSRRHSRNGTIYIDQQQ